MRIESVEIEGFGHFSSATFRFSPEVTVICGPNEAGKSTVLAFIKFVLFGVPSHSRENRYTPRGGGRHGGRVTLVDDCGTRFVIERTVGAKGGVLTVTRGDGQRLEPTILSSVLGGVTRNVFQQVFAFGLTELQALGALSSRELQAQIYAAGTGAEYLPRARDVLTKRADELFLPTGQNQPIARLLKALEETDRELVMIASQAARYGDLTAQGDELEARLGYLECDAKRLQSSAEDLRKLQQARDDFDSLSRAKVRLASLPDTSRYPSDGLARLDELEVLIRTAASAVHDSADVLAKAKASASREVPNESLLAEAERIDDLRRGQEGYERARKDAAAGISDSALRIALNELGQGWTAERVQAVDTSAPVRTEAERWRAELDAAVRKERESSLSHKAARESLRDANVRLAISQEALQHAPDPGLDREAIESQRRLCQVATSALDAWRRASTRHADIAAQVQDFGQEPRHSRVAHESTSRGMNRLVPGAFVAIGILIAFGGSTLGGAVAMASVLTGASLGIAGGYLGFRTRKTKNVAVERSDDPTAGLLRRREQSANDLEQATQRLEDAYAALRLGSPSQRLPSDDDLHAIAAGLRRAEAALQQVFVREAAVAAIHAEVRQLQVRLEDAELEHAAASEVLSMSRERWREWLPAHGLPLGLTPEYAGAFFAQVANARERIKTFSASEEQLCIALGECEAYERRVAEVANRRDLTGEEVVGTVDELCERLDGARTAATRRESANLQLVDAEADAESRRRSLAEYESELAELLERASVKDGPALRILAGNAQTRKDLERELQSAEDRLHQVAGSGEDFANFVTRLKFTSRLENEEALSLTAKAVESATAERSDLLRQQGRIETELSALVSDDRASQLRIHRADMIEQLRDAAQKWATLKAAVVLLNEAQRKYETERQPGVIRHAERFFRTVTAGRYERISAPMGQQAFFVATPGGAPLKPDQLSRGTQEQLYLAVRLGLIRQFAENAACLPVLVDDILVNFDPGRARRAAEGFAELARDHQVIIFTCHPTTRATFLSVQPGTTVIDLEDSGPERNTPALATG